MLNKNQKYKQLLAFAKQACASSYSPYSKFKVGAAVLCENDKVFCGTNIENASYGLSVCAERVAVWTAIANGAKQIKAVAVYSAKGNITPCGACRQVIAEFSKSADIVYNDKKDKIKIVKISELLPKTFRL